VLAAALALSACGDRAAEPPPAPSEHATATATAPAPAPAPAPSGTAAGLAVGAYPCFEPRGSQHLGALLSILEGGRYRFDTDAASGDGGYRVDADGRSVRFEGGTLEAEGWRGEVARREDGEPMIVLRRDGAADRLDCGFGG
jgi:hypothetical protein